LVHGGARLVYVGKQAGLHSRSQSEIHELLCQLASKGEVVVRLKGGDPYIFGRGGEEAQYLKGRGINVHCVPGVSVLKNRADFRFALHMLFRCVLTRFGRSTPYLSTMMLVCTGITAASGICAELGIPLTYRGVATSVRFMTGHVVEGRGIDVECTGSAACENHTTLVVYMGLANLPALTQQLIDGGLRRDTPAVAVERGTTVQQRSVYAPLEQLQYDVERECLESPTLIVIGEVVSLAPGWRDTELRRFTAAVAPMGQGLVT
jgi:uroporphyrin-III C-methyltransferase